MISIMLDGRSLAAHVMQHTKQPTPPSSSSVSRRKRSGNLGSESVRMPTIADALFYLPLFKILFVLIFLVIYFMMATISG